MCSKRMCSRIPGPSMCVQRNPRCWHRLRTAFVMSLLSVSNAASCSRMSSPIAHAMQQGQRRPRGQAVLSSTQTRQWHMRCWQQQQPAGCNVVWPHPWWLARGSRRRCESFGDSVAQRLRRIPQSNRPGAAGDITVRTPVLHVSLRHTLPSTTVFTRDADLHVVSLSHASRAQISHPTTRCKQQSTAAEHSAGAEPVVVLRRAVSSTARARQPRLILSADAVRFQLTCRPSTVAVSCSGPGAAPCRMVEFACSTSTCTLILPAPANPKSAACGMGARA